MSKQTARNGRPLKIPKNLLLEKKIVRKGMRLARLEHRNFSNEVEALIAREFDRLFPDEAAKERLQLMRGLAA